MEFIQQLEKALRLDLPGPEAQYKMAHLARQGAINPAPDVKQAGVLALFYPQQSEWNLVFIERVRHANDRHSGQISFPGGKHDATDPDFAYTALRETQEEVGVKSEDIHLLGELSPLYIPVSNFMVNPFVGFLDYAPEFIPEVKEVADIVQVPFRKFMNPATRQLKDMQISQHVLLKNVPFYNVKEKVIWGATAMMLSELTEIVHRFD